jgi:chromosome partitioning protein
MIIAVTNRKGGSGKTAIAANLAVCYAQAMKTLLIDLDIQADASALLGIEDSGEALSSALIGRGSLETAIRESSSGVDVAPAGEALGHISEAAHADSLRRALASINSRGYRAVVIDCAPGLDPLSVAAWRAASLALVPVDGPEGFRAVARLRHAWDDLRLDSTRMRLVHTCHDSRRILDRELVRQAEATYAGAVMETRIRESIVVRESAAWRVPLVLYSPTHWVADDMRRLAREVYHHD